MTLITIFIYLISDNFNKTFHTFETIGDNGEEFNSASQDEGNRIFYLEKKC